MTRETETGEGCKVRQAALEAKLRKTFRALTDEAREDDYVGLTLDLRDAKTKAAKLSTEVRALKELVNGFEGDQAETIRRMARKIHHKESEVYRANDKAAAAIRQVYVLKKRIRDFETKGFEI
ncbi:MAG: hypothetical protein CME84_14960 [Henriciella sp.]|nr:hypothetical protein [Henriciella sp.]|tara:strand:- start:2543 stop:2911 length:369 start_codon:yes stop_codon:yes gene_type:complete